MESRRLSFTTYISLISTLGISLCINTNVIFKANAVNNSHCSIYNNECKYPLSNHYKIKNTILEWWKHNNISIPLECKSKNRYKDNKDVAKYFSVPKIESYPCKPNQSPQQCLFTGNVKNGHLEGKGKLKILYQRDWISLPEDTRNNITQRNMCYNLINVRGKKSLEIIGKFKKGLLSGTAKITSEDKSITISNFKHGRFHGFRRDWDELGNLIRVGEYNMGLKTGYHWTSELGHLIFLDESPIVNKFPLAIMFEYSKAGFLGEPIIGNFHLHQGTLENVHKVELTGIQSNVSECLLKLEYKILEKELYKYVIQSKSKVPISSYKTNPLCRLGLHSNVNMSTSKRLKTWFESMDALSDPVDGLPRGYQVLWYLRPELEQVDKIKSIKLISNITLDHKSSTATASILGSDPLRMTLNYVALDNKKRLHGYCDISVVKEDEHLIPKDKTLEWIPTRFRGMFLQGNLNGIALIGLNLEGFNGWFTLKEGVLHGPCIINGIRPVLPVKHIYTVYLF